MSYNKFPWSNMHGFNMDWVIETVENCKKTVDSIVEEVNNIFSKYVTKDELTNNRKLSEDADFTGTLSNKAKTALQVVQQIDNNRDQIVYLNSQFSDGQTGLVVDGGFYNETGIKRNYNGGSY